MLTYYHHVGYTFLARRNCKRTGNTEWFERHTERLLWYAKTYLPHGAGFDSGTTIDLQASREEKLVFLTSFHHMNGNGYYDEWTSHTVVVTPSLWGDYHLRITGRNRNEIKDHIGESFDWALRQEIAEVWENGERVSSKVVGHD